MMGQNRTISAPPHSPLRESSTGPEPRPVQLHSTLSEIGIAPKQGDHPLQPLGTGGPEVRFLGPIDSS